jgi:pimeloyl-ACP methyl ester carboxylesterase
MHDWHSDEERKMTLKSVLAGGAAALIASTTGIAASAAQSASPVSAPQVQYHTVTIDGVDVFYREAGPKDAPVIVLLHGFPSSSHMYRNLIIALADRYHVIAPDYPGFGNSAAPARDQFAYTFDNYAKLVEQLTERLGAQRYALYLFDYGAPVGMRLATKHPERVTALIVQNGNAYNEGIAGFWDPIKAYWRTHASKEREAIRWLTSIAATNWQYTNGVSDTSLVSPDGPKHDQAGMDRPGNQEIQLDLFYDYRTNIPLYPVWQSYFRDHRPPTLVMWGAKDEIFVGAGAAPYKRDNPDAEIHLLDTGHFALETHGSEISTLIHDFLGRKLSQ